MSAILPVLQSLRGAKAVSFVSITEPDLRAGNPFNGRLRKQSYVNGMLNTIYARSVNRQREREQQPLDASGNVEQFTALPRKWGTRLQRADGTILPLVEHKGKHYMEVQVGKSLRHVYMLDNGQPLGAKGRRLARLWLRKKVEGRRQQVDKPVILRDYSLDNLRELTIDGQTIVVNG